MTKSGSAVRGIFVSSLVLVAVSGCGGGPDKAVQKAPVGYGAVTEVVEAPGTITPKAQVTVTATAAGTVGTLLVEDGQQVTLGQPLLRIESPEAQAALTQAKAADAQAAASASSSGTGSISGIDFSDSEAVADANAKQAFDAATTTADQITDAAVKQAVLDQISKARADYATASADVRTTIGNFNKGIASVSDVFGSLSAAQRTQTRAAVAIAQKTVDSLTVSAPVAGLVSLRSGTGGSGASGLDVSGLLSQLGGAASGLASQLGSLAGGAGGGGSSSGSSDTVIVAGSPVASGAPLMVITDPSVLTVTAQVDETSILKVSKGIPANIQIDAVPGASYPAHVLSVDIDARQTSQGGQTYRVRLSLDAGKLGDGSAAPVPKPGMTAVVDLQVASVEHVLTVPSAAVVNVGNQDTVWLVAKGVAHRRVVRLGAQGDTVVEVAGGLSTGDVVVTAGADKVHDGEKL